MMRTAVQTNVSAEAYLQMEEIAERKHEFVYGNLFEMPGTTLRHGNMIKKICRVLDPSLHQNGFESYTTDVKVAAVEGQVSFYPDITIAKAIIQDQDSYFVREPVLIAEILSPSTRTYDSTDKFIQYRKIVSLQYYLLIEPEKQVVIFYKKDSNGEWQSDTFTESDETIDFPLLGASLTLANIYGN